MPHTAPTTKKTENTIKLGKDTLKLTFDIEKWEKIEDEFEDLSKLTAALSGKGHLRRTLHVALILAGKDYLDEDQIIEHGLWKAHQVTPTIEAIFGAINEGMHMEQAEDDEDEVVDVVLEELRKKEPRGD